MTEEKKYPKGQFYYKGKDAFDGKFDEVVISLMRPRKITNIVRDIEVIYPNHVEEDVVIRNYVTAYSINTPLGTFDTIAAAALAHGFSTSWVYDRLKSHPLEFTKVAVGTGKRLKKLKQHDSDNKYAQRFTIHTPLGIFISVKAAAIAHGRSPTWIDSRIVDSGDQYKKIRKTK